MLLGPAISGPPEAGREAVSRGFTASDPAVADAGKAFVDAVRFRHDVRSAFDDMLHMWVITIRNSVEPKGDAWSAREAEYLALVSRYDRKIVDVFAGALGAVALASTRGRNDHVGQLYQQIGANVKGLGQFFTPYNVSSFMASAAFTRESVEEAIAEKGHVLAQEPSCGAGGMVVAMGEALEALGFEPLNHLRVHAVDLDRTCVDMTYVQSHLQRVPCYVEQANALIPDSGREFAYRFPNLAYSAQVTRQGA